MEAPTEPGITPPSCWNVQGSQKKRGLDAQSNKERGTFEKQKLSPAGTEVFQYSDNPNC